METCYHCGDECDRHPVFFQDKHFCCQGCKLVFQILSENELEHYYSMEKSPGINPTGIAAKFSFLKEESIANGLLEFDEQDTKIINLLIPSIHCSSCIWVLENLHKLNPAVIQAQVNFPQKTVRIIFKKEGLSVYSLVKLLCSIGYEPYISLEDSQEKDKKVDRSLIYKLGVAGFAFGNIMFLSFPEYFEVGEFWLERYKYVFRWLMFVFSIPVVFYSGWGYFTAAYKGLRAGFLNIDVPIALGIGVLFLRSSAEIILDWGTGFFDSLAGLIFFLLLGKFFQQKTYAFLSFERDYKSYFPIAVTQLIDSTERQTQVNELKAGDHILIRNGELIPVDSILIKGTARIDYSFVTGESDPITKSIGETLFAGGKQEGDILELEVLNSVKQSYLTQLWSNDIFSKGRQQIFASITDAISKRFTIAVLSIAFISTLFWIQYEPRLALHVFTAVLIVACPCAIALAAPFTLGNMLRFFGRKKLYLKDSQTVETMAQLDTLVFDKTGTLTSAQKNEICYEGIALSDAEISLLTSTLRASNHPLSRSLYQFLKENEIMTLDNYEEVTGKGIAAKSGCHQIKLGSLQFVGDSSLGRNHENNITSTSVHVVYQDNYKGVYNFSCSYREGLDQVFEELSKHYQLIVLSGDNDRDRKRLEQLLPKTTQYYFDQKPEDKLTFIKTLQEQGRKVMMVGDGLNDAGALAQSDVGLAIAENVNVFTPACDGILDAGHFKLLPKFLMLSHRARQVIKRAFLLSLFYNLIGLGFAVTGHLKPVIAAILMPLSSISIVAFATLYTSWLYKNLQMNPDKSTNTDKSHLLPRFVRIFLPHHSGKV